MFVTAAERAQLLAARRDDRQLVACTDDEAGTVEAARRRGGRLAALDSRELLAVLLARGRKRILVGLDTAEAERLEAQRATHLAHTNQAIYGETAE